jgi:MoaA/NifB/PqqE/SkfB family radical SAM enzyme
VERSWQKMVHGIETLIRIRNSTGGATGITVSTVINKNNIDHVEKFIDFCSDIGIDNVSFGIVQEEFARENIGIEKNEPLAKLIDFLIHNDQNQHMVDNSIEYLEEMAGGFNKGKLCWAGYHSLYADCYGNIFPCFYYMEKNLAVNNVNNISLNKIWKSREFDTLRRKLLHCHKCFFVCQMELNTLYNKFASIKSA